MNPVSVRRFVPNPRLPCVVSAVPAEVSIEDEDRTPGLRRAYICPFEPKRIIIFYFLFLNYLFMVFPFAVTNGIKKLK